MLAILASYVQTAFRQSCDSEKYIVIWHSSALQYMLAILGINTNNNKPI